MVQLATVRGLVVFSAVFAICAAIGAGCGGEKCGDEFVGGGTFHVTFAGDLAGTLAGRGSGEAALERWFNLDGGWADLLGKHERDDMTIAMLGRPVSMDPLDAFTASIVIEPGTLSGCEDAALVAVFAGVERSWVQLLNANGDSLLSGDVTHSQYDWAKFEGDRGTQTFHLSNSSGSCGRMNEIDIEVSWAVDPGVSYLIEQSCGEGGWSSG